MTISLYDALIPQFRQLLGSTKTLLTKAEAHCAEHGLTHEELIGARLIDNMQPFAYQVKCTSEHSIGAIRAVRAGVFTPSTAYPPDNFADLNALVDAADADLTALDRAEIDGFVGQDMRFEFKSTIIPFTAENFLLSFAQPNFYFHATTAYDLLRMKGVTLGKMVFLGRLAVKG
jgi:uncharacterized protein